MAKRRGSGEGSVFQRKADARWVGQLDLGVGPDGKRKRRTIYGGTQREVIAAMRDLRRQHDAGLPVAADRQTVEQFLERWLEQDVRPTKAPRTFASYAETVRVHIIPEIGKRQLAKLTPADVQGLMIKKATAPRSGSDQPLSASTVSYIRTVLRIALGRAEKWGLVGRNVATLVDPPRKTRTEIKPLDPAQARTLLRTVQGDRLEALYRVAIATGLRLGEALALRWSDIDLQSGTLRVARTLQRVPHEDRANLERGARSRLIYKEPKTESGRRTIPLPAHLVIAMEAHRDRQDTERERAGVRWLDEGLVFATPLGGPLEPSGVLKRLKEHLATAGLPSQRFHDLRHCAASLLLAQNIPPQVVSKILGHAQLATTADLYQHVYPAAHRDAMSAMDRVLLEDA